MTPLPIFPATIETIDLTLEVFGPSVARAFDRTCAAADATGADLEPLVIERLNDAIETASGRQRTALLTLRSHVICGRLPLILERAKRLAG